MIETRDIPATAHRERRPLAARAGVTLIELMLALSLLSLVGICIVMMVKATADGTAGQTDGRRHLVRMQSLEAQVASVVRPCSCILAAGTNYLVVWTGDGPDINLATNQTVNLSELAMFELDTNTQQLRLYRTTWPAGTTVAAMIAADATYAASSNWYNAAQAAKSTGYFNGTLLANKVTSFNVTLDSGTPTAAMMATLWITLNDGVVTQTMVIPAALRWQMAPQ
jgi:prepilin-type N-terminal cleavage/methylation domain-containing protein